MINRLLILIICIALTYADTMNAQRMLTNSDVLALSQGNEHTALIKVFGFGKTAEEALERAKMNAVYAVMFTTIPNSNCKNPIVGESGLTIANMAYFKSFFGVDDFETLSRNKNKIWFGNEQAPYRNFVSLATDGTVDPNDRMKAGKEYRVGAPFSVKFHELRAKLESDGIIRKLGLDTKNSKPKKPTIMVVPDDEWCLSRGYEIHYDNQGIKKICPDYYKALQGEIDLNNVITQIGSMFSDRGFNLKDLKAALDKIEGDNARKNMNIKSLASSPIDILNQTARADIWLKTTWKVAKDGPYRYVTFTVKAIDAYTSKQIASATGTGERSSHPEIAVLLKEAVLSHVDNLQSQMQKHFDDLLENGREVSLTIMKVQGSDVDLNEMYDFLTDWLDNNTVNGVYSKLSSTENEIQYEQIRIPMYKKSGTNELAVDAERHFRDLEKSIKEKYNYKVVLSVKGLGEVWLELSDM